MPTHERNVAGKTAKFKKAAEGCTPLTSLFGATCKKSDTLGVGDITASRSTTDGATPDDNSSSILLQSESDLIKVFGDGRCLFRCLVLACETTSSSKPLISNENHKSNILCDRLRTAVVTALRNEQKELEEKAKDLPLILDKRSGKLYESVEERLTDMEKTSTFAGYLEIVAAACLLRRQIWIYYDAGDNNYYRLLSKSPVHEFDDRHPPICLLYEMDTAGKAGHFNLLYSKDHQCHHNHIQWSWSGVNLNRKITDMIDPSANYFNQDLSPSQDSQLQAADAQPFQMPPSQASSSQAQSIDESSLHTINVEALSSSVENSSSTSDSRSSILKEQVSDNTGSEFAHRDMHSSDPAHGPHFASAKLGPYQPRDITFQSEIVTGRLRSFKASWYDIYPWLEYSPALNAAFCFQCRLYNNSRSSGDQTFISQGFSQWKKALETGRGIKGHALSEQHKRAMNSWCELNSTHESVMQKIDSGHLSSVQKHLQHLETIVETLIWVGKQGLPLRGHDESDISENRGNFLELLELRSRDCASLKKYLTSETFKYTSPEIQNELIDIIAQQIQKDIVKGVNNSGAFSFILDGTQDITVVEQLSFCVRFVDENFDVQERFLGFWDCPKTDAASLLSMVETVFLEVGLSFDILRGQCYDGASNMTGCNTGLGIRILQKQPMAPAIHCWNHQANLILVHACSPVKDIRNTLNRVQEVYKFFSSHKRRDVFRDVQEKNSSGRVRSLKCHCDTRWSSWLAAVRDLRATLGSVYDSLIVIDDSDTTSHGCDAGQLAKTLQRFTFVFCLEFLFRIFTITDQFSQDLQSSTIDIETARNKAELVNDAIKGLRVDWVFDEIWQSAVALATTIDVQEPIEPARKIKRPSRYDENSGTEHQFDSAKTEYRVQIYYPVIDRIREELAERFCTKTHAVLGNLYQLLMSFKNKSPVEPEVVSSVAAFYRIDEEALKAELHVLHNSRDLQDITNVQELGQHLIKMKLVSWFPVLSSLMRVYLSLPVTSSTSERSFSQLKLVKDEKRSTMTETRLRGLAIMKIEKNLLKLLKPSDIVQIFAGKKNRRQKLS